MKASQILGAVAAMAQMRSFASDTPRAPSTSYPSTLSKKQQRKRKDKRNAS